MPHNYNTSVFNWAIEKFNLKDGLFFTNNLPYTFTPVIPITPICEIVISRKDVASVAGNTTIYTTPSDKDFYVNSITSSLSKSATSSVPTTVNDITVVINSQTVTLSSLAVDATTYAQALTTSTAYPRPIKLDRSSIIQIGDAFTLAGTFTRQVTITGYIENTLA